LGKQEEERLLAFAQDHVVEQEVYHELPKAACGQQTVKPSEKPIGGRCSGLDLGIDVAFREV
jgi:hypothetical protein